MKRETGLFAGALLLLMFGVAVTFDALVTRPLWLDEVHTQIVAGRASPALVLADLRAGIDTAPGLLHLALWALGRVVELSAPVLHLVPFVLVWLGLVFVYATLRRHFGIASSSAGVLAVGAHSLVIQMTFEARFYGPWLFLAAVFAWAVGLEASRRRDVLVGLASVLLCTIHWFGIISLAILCAGVVAVRWREWRQALRTVMPAAAGLAALLACLPILLGQLAAVTAPSWIPAPDRRQLWDMARVFYVAVVPLAAAAILAVARFALPRRAPRRVDAGVAALASLALMPVAMLIVSWVLQPSLLDRYATVAALAWAPLVAAAVATVPARLAWLALPALLAVGAVNYRRAIGGVERYAREFARGLEAYRAALDQTTLPIVFQSRHVQFPLVAEHPQGKERTVFLFLPDSTLDRMFPPASHLRLVGPFVRFEREAAVLHERVYGYPHVRTPSQLDSLPSFLLVGSDASLPPGYKNVQRFVAAVFPGYQTARIHQDVALVRR